VPESQGKLVWLVGEPQTNATSLRIFRRPLDDNTLEESLFAKVGAELQARGFNVNTGTIVNAIIIVSVR